MHVLFLHTAREWSGTARLFARAGRGISERGAKVTLLVTPDSNVHLAVSPRRDPNQPCVNTVGVSNLDESIASVLANGGSIAVPKMPVPGIGWLAYCKDTEGHIFGMMQSDTKAG